MEAITLIYSCC